MIVPSMNSEELLHEIARDYCGVMRKAMYLTDSLRREAIKSKNKYVHRLFDYKSKFKNDWIIIVDYYVAEPTFIAVVYYLDKFGFNGIMVGADHQTLTFFTPHFLERFNERFLNQTNISKKELLIRFLSQNSVGSLQIVSDEVDMKNRIFTRFKEGIGLGYVEVVKGARNQIVFFKTFISNEMIFRSQEEIFDIAGKDFEIYWDEMFKHTRKKAFD